VGGVKVMVWCGIWGTRINGPYFIHGTLTGETYRVMLEEDVFLDLLNPDGDFRPFSNKMALHPTMHYVHASGWIHSFLDVG
jgi:hypothetical protein